MKTLYTNNPADCVEIIKRGGIVAVPTETVYGLAVNALDEAAVKAVYEVKGRPNIKPLSIMVKGADDIYKYCEDIPIQAMFLADKYFPGSLTIVLKSKDNIPSIVRAGGDTIGLRCPFQADTLKLLSLLDVPLAVPSANPSDLPEAKTVEEVRAYFDGKIDAVLCTESSGHGRPSTVMSLSETPYKIFREGAISEFELADYLSTKMDIIGITGGTGAGKTTALEVLAEMGALILDADKVYHDLTMTSLDMKNELTARFGEVYEGDVLQRKKLGAVVFNDNVALEDLNKITSKYVRHETDRRLRCHAMAGGKLAAIDAIRLIESKISEICEPVIGITADKNVRCRRIMERENIDESYALARINAQQPDEFFKENCDMMLVNDGTKQEFREMCEKIFNEILL